MQKILTAIVPVYNSAKYVKNCLDSLNHPEINIIVNIDGGSTDDSSKIVEEYCHDKPNFTIIHSPHQGVMSARQECLKFVNTPFFSFVDSDDTVNIKNYVSLCHAMQDNGYKIGNGRTTVFLPNCPIPFNSRKWDKTTIDFAKDKKELSNTTCTFWDKIFSNDSIELFQGASHQKVYEDLEFVYHALAKKRLMFHTNDLIYNYRMHENSASATGLDILKVDGLKGLLSATSSMQEKFKQSHLLEEYQSELDAITIKLVYQRIYNILKNPKIENKKEMAELVFQILSAYIPNWEQNPYFLEGFKGSELNDYLFYIITKILIHLNNVQITKKEDDYQVLLSSYNAKLVLKKCYRSQK